MKKTVSLLLFAFFSSCNLYDRKDEVLMIDEDYVENYREFSPNKSMILINYSLDLGAFGYGDVGTAILKVSDTTKEIRQHSLPNKLREVRWIDNDIVSAKIDIIPFIRNGKKIKINDTVINNVKIKITAFDWIEQNSRLIVEYREISPNRKFELVAYRYFVDKNNFSPLHISIIQVGNSIPKYGNYFIGEKESDYILFGSWNKKNQLIFYSNNQNTDLIRYYMVQNRPQIKFHIVKDEKKYGSKYLWKEIRNSK